MVMIKIVTIMLFTLSLTACTSMRMECKDLSNPSCRSLILQEQGNDKYKFDAGENHTFLFRWIRSF